MIYIGIDPGLSGAIAVFDLEKGHLSVIDMPVVEVERTDTGAMDDVVHAAAAMARPGDTVLLAPGCASWDMFRDYGHRGDEFAAAVLRHLGR